MPDKHVHTFGEWTNFTAENVACENRLFYRVCTSCNSIEWKQGSYSDHDWDVVTTAPTCQAQGYDTKTCKICGKIEVENYKDIVDHAWAEEYSFDNSYHWLDCDTCDESKGKEEHTVGSSGECSVCKQLVGATEGVLYDVSTDGTFAEVIGYEGTATKVRIADTYNDLPVKNIYEKAFYGNNVITSVIIPDNVTSIGDAAFHNCDNITSIIIPDNVNRIGTFAFYSCDNLISVTIGNTVTSIGEDAFNGCSSLTSIDIPDSVTTIGEYAFRNCSGLTSVTIGNNIASIGEDAFGNSLKLKFNEYENCKYLGNKNNPYLVLISAQNTNFSTYAIHEDAKVIANGAFRGCSRLTNITISGSITIIGEYAFYLCDSLTSLTIGDSVTTIGEYAFSWCRDLTSVAIGDRVTSIGEHAFSSCGSLTSINLPDSVTSIGNSTFSFCEGLTSISFQGTVEEWNAITKGSSWKYNVPATEVICSNGTVTL